MKTEYNEEQKQRIYEWREKNREKYNEQAKKQYKKNKAKILGKAKEKREELKRRRVFIVFQAIENTEYSTVLETFDTLGKAQTYIRRNNINGYVAEMEVK